MKVVRFIDDQWILEHPTGAIAFKHLLQGEDGTPENFMLILGRQDRDYTMPIHRHNFDQIRLPLVGDMNLGRRGILREGQVGYFPEGLSYGPQEDALGHARPGERVQLVLQFGGASGQGFMSIEQRRKALVELGQIGRIEGRLFHHPDGKTEPLLNAAWKHVYGTRMRFPSPRYQHIIVAEPRAFNWLSVAGQPGVERQYFGSFSERGVWAEKVRIAPGAAWQDRGRAAYRLVFVLQGKGTVEGNPVETWSAIELGGDESAIVSASREEGLELFMMGLPWVQAPSGDPAACEEIPEFGDPLNDPVV
ncbi:hypothetical protein [Pigmentiphaga sp.]|uniref:hypothetical protein n=1 Tax=Pigmentiphaga sp. TaxID=1977564 RepID=UPI0025CFC119|nr:hypothetical protein [Pigmentiphaga sp.]